MAKRAAAGTLALAVCLTGGLVSAGAANAAAGFTFNTRVSGEDRYLTSVEASKAAFPTTASSVVITNGLSEVDGLTASYVAGLRSAPILYTSGPSTISAAVQAEITRLKPTTIYIVGGETVVTKSVEDALKATAGVTTVTRYGGADRYETAAKVATSGTVKPAKVIVASGVSFADALVAGPVAYKQKYPILLTAATGVPSYTEAALKTLAVDTVNVVGGETVVTAATYAAVGGDKRLFGDTRQATAAAFAADAITNEGFSAANVALVGNTNANAADALVAAPLAALNTAPILFVDNNGNTATATYLTTNSGKLTGKGFVFGGTTAVSAASVTAATTAATSTAGTTGSIAVTPANAVSLIGLASGGDNVSDDRTYTVSGLAADTTYRVTLVNAANVRVATDGSVTFKSSADTASASGFSADPVGSTSTGASISVVNGSVISGDPVTTTTALAVSGNLSFTVEGSATPESVIPVVYINGGTGKTAAQGGTSARLETSATTAGAFAPATETFGLGGAVSYAPVEAAAGAVGAGTAGASPATSTAVTAIDKAADYFVANGVTLFYDASDQFRISGAPVSLADFEAQLSKGDGLLPSTYASDASLQSTFSLEDLTPIAITGVTVADGAASSLKVTWSAPATAPESYKIYRKASAETNVLSDYTLVTTLSGSITTPTFTDTGLTAGTTYAYAVTQVVDGDESPLGASSASVDDQAAPAGVTGAKAGAPTILESRATDLGTSFELSSGDSLQLIFSEPVSLPAGASFRVSDGVNAGTITVGTNANAGVLPAGTYNGQAVVAGQAYRVQLTGALGSASPANTTVAFPATITQVTSGVVDLDEGNTLLLTSGDRTLQSEAFSPVYAATVPAPTAAATPATKTATFTSAVALSASYIDPTAISKTGAGTIQSTTLSADGKVITVVLTGTVNTGDTVVLDKAKIKSIDGIAGAAGNVTATF